MQSYLRCTRSKAVNIFVGGSWSSGSKPGTGYKYRSVFSLISLFLASAYSKGHEFRAVFIFGLNEGYIRSEEPEEIEREAALLYVAMTRAKELLYMSYHSQSSVGKAMLPSRFIIDFQDAIDVLKFRET
jgi:hypothetical protein